MQKMLKLRLLDHTELPLHREVFHIDVRINRTFFFTRFIARSFPRVGLRGLKPFHFRLLPESVFLLLDLLAVLSVDAHPPHEQFQLARLEQRSIRYKELLSQLRCALLNIPVELGVRPQCVPRLEHPFGR